MRKQHSVLGRLWLRTWTRAAWALSRFRGQLHALLWRVRIWNARRNVRRALKLIKRQMDRVGMPRTARRAFWRDLAEDRLEYLENFWRS